MIEITEIHAISGLEDGSLFYILDKNNNNDFQDDVKYYYSKNLSDQINQNQSLLDSFPIIKMKIKRLKNGEFYNDEIVFRIFPDAHYYNYDDKNNIRDLKKILN